MKLTFVGAGYVGLTSAAVFSRFGHKVWVLDIDKEKIKTVKAGKAPFHEPELDELVAKGIKACNLIPTASYEEAIPNADVVFICVGTPSKKDGSTDLSYVLSAAESIGRNLGDRYTVVVVKSTVPPGTTERVGKIISEARSKRQEAGEKVGDFDAVDSPEFLAEGRAVEDTKKPSRIVIGAGSEKPVKVLRKLFSPFSARGGSPLLVCDTRSAELIKYASNAFLATKVSFINEISQIAEKFGADVTKVAEGMGLDDRVGPKFLSAGLGYGGSCFPKDVASLLFVSNHAGYEFGILQAATKVNQEQHERFVKKIAESLGGLKSRKVAVLGLAFKPGSDDMRKAVSVEIVNKLIGAGAEVCAYDPQAVENARKVLSRRVKFAKDAYEALKGADCLVLVTEWPEFAKLNWKRVKGLMHGNLIADGRNLYDPVKIRKAGFEYIGVGRGSGN